MKHIFLFLLSLSIGFADECNVRNSSSLVGTRDVGPVRNLVKNTNEPGKCQVTFELTIDGVDYPVSGEYEGLEQMASLCHYAVNDARTELLVSLGGTFDSESATTCKEGETDLVDNIKVGDTILETEVGRNKMNKYFTFQDARCRLFTQKLAYKRELRVYHGVICEIENSSTNWIVVDKW